MNWLSLSTLYKVIPIFIFLVTQITLVFIYSKKTKSNIYYATLLFLSYIQLLLTFDIINAFVYFEKWHPVFLKTHTSIWMLFGFIYYYFIHTFLNVEKKETLYLLILFLISITLTIFTNLILFVACISIGIPIVLSLYKMALFFFKETNILIKRQALSISLGTVFTILAFCIFNIFLANFYPEIFRYKFSAATTIILTSCILLSTTCFQFLTFTNIQACKYIFNQNTDLIAFLRIDGRILQVNKAFNIFVKREEHDIFEHKLSDVLNLKTFSTTARYKDSPFNLYLEETKISCKLSMSPILNQQIIKGYIVIIKPTDAKNYQSKLNPLENK